MFRLWDDLGEVNDLRDLDLSCSALDVLGHDSHGLGVIPNRCTCLVLWRSEFWIPHVDDSSALRDVAIDSAHLPSGAVRAVLQVDCWCPCWLVGDPPRACVQAREGADAVHHVSVGVFAQLLLQGSGLYENVKRILHSTSGNKRHWPPEERHVGPVLSWPGEELNNSLEINQSWFVFDLYFFKIY